jgi:glycosyltransferase involved in cell wall biosynthesis
MKKPLISIIISTYFGSTGIVEIPLKSIEHQTCPKNVFEVIIAHNSGENDKYIQNIAKKYSARLIKVDGKPAQTCRQINLGVKAAKGEYILLLDHDISLSRNLLKSFLEEIENKSNVDAWYVPYKIVARGKFLTKIRNFEESFYKDSIIATPRIIKRKTFLNTEFQYDPRLNSGPADWDLTIQLKLMNITFNYLKEYFYHHEEGMSLLQFVSKKTIYSKGGEIYKNKWRKKNNKIYNSIVKKQYDPFYRLFGMFMENGKWKNLLPNIHLYLSFLTIKVVMASIYYYNLKRLK